MRIYPGRIMNNFIEQNKRQYAIPVYQRNYEWAEDQCVRLFEDIVAAARSEREHFCGSVVYSLIKNENNINYYIIIDGQQRMTTVYLMLKALVDNASTEQEKRALLDVLLNHDPFDPYAVNMASKLKLKPIKTDNSQLFLLMDGKTDQMDKTSGIWHNYQLFCRLVREQLEQGVTVNQIYYGLQQLTCVDISLEPSDNAQEIFERINSTGIPLSLADKIRNFVLMVDADQEELYETYWLPAENAVRRENMTAFLLDFLNMKTDDFVREDMAYEEFKHLYAARHYSHRAILEEILHYAEFYKTFLYGDERFSPAVNDLLADLQKLKQKTLFLFLFHVFDDFTVQPPILDEAELVRVLTFLRNYSIRRIMCEVNSNSLRGLYKTLHARVFAQADNKAHYYDALVCFFRQLNSRDVLAPDAVFLSALEHNNLYRKNALCKYLLAALENQGKEHLVTDKLTIEHILPQNKNLSKAWQDMLGNDWLAVRDRTLHTLGNLTLTGYNSELGDLPFAQKKEKLVEVGTKVVHLDADILSQPAWTEAAITNRARRLSAEIMALYPITPPAVNISFADVRCREYSCDAPREATYTAPESFVLQGERVYCTSFAEMLKQVVARLYALDRTVIEQMARKNEQPLTWSQSILFSYDPDKVNGEYRISGTDIYESTGFSAFHIISIIRSLLDRYEIDHSDFAYSARANKKTETE